jgi:hypothetical protein
VKDFTNLSDPKGASPDYSSLCYRQFSHIWRISFSDWCGLRFRVT